MKRSIVVEHDSETKTFRSASYGYAGGGGGRMAKNGFVFRPGEPTNPRAWLGVAPLVMAKRFPIINGSVTNLRSNEDLMWAINIARECEGREDMHAGAKPWRRVLLPMLLEEAKKRGLDV